MIEGLNCYNLQLTFYGDILDSAKYELHKKTFYEKNKYFIKKFLGRSIRLTLYNTTEKIANVTGIKTSGDIKFIKKFLIKKLYFKINLVKVNNSLFRYNRLRPTPLKVLCEKLTLNPIKNYNFSYNSDKFPAIFLKHNYRKCGYPTCLLFSSGKAVFLGSKQISNINVIFDCIVRLYNS